MALSLTERIVLSIYFGCIGLFGLIANLGILIILHRSKHYRKYKSTLFLYSVLIASVLACLCQIPYYIFSLVAILPPINAESHEIACKASVFSTYCISGVKILLLTVMSLDRFVAVVYPYFYAQRVSRCMVLTSLAGSWIATVVIILPLPAIDGLIRYTGKQASHCRVDWQLMNKAYMFTAAIMSFFVPAVIMVVTNVKVFLVAREKNKTVSCERKLHAKRGAGNKIIINSSAKQVGSLKVETVDELTTRGFTVKYPNSQTEKGLDQIKCSNNEDVNLKADETESVRPSSNSDGAKWSIIAATLLLVLAFFITWLPFVVSRICTSLFALELSTRSVMYPVASTVLDIVLNPLIIIGTKRRLREKCMQYLHREKSNRSSGD